MLPQLRYYWNEATNATSWDKPIISLADRPEQASVAGARFLSTSASAASLASKAKEALAAQAGGGGAVGLQGKVTSKDLADAKQRFQKQVSTAVVKVLGRYSKKECTTGRITNQADFKHLARKFTHVITEKETKAKADETGQAPIAFDDEVKHKVKNYVKGQMQKVGAVYVRKADGTSKKQPKKKEKRKFSAVAT
jgi:hypothetical protein